MGAPDIMEALASNKTVRTVEVAAGAVEYESDMTMRSLRGLMGAASSGDLGELMACMALFVLSWPYGGEPSDPEAWDDLKRSEFNELTEMVLKDLGTAGNA